MADAIFFIIIACVALAAWLGMAISALRMLRHRQRPFVWLMMNGWAFFWGNAFAPEARNDRRRFLLAVGVFGLALLAAVVIAVVKAA